MSSVVFISKEPAGGAGNFKYTYACTCDDGTNAKNVEVTSANDNQARALAQMECDENCGNGYPFDLSAKMLEENTVFVGDPSKRITPLSTAYQIEWPIQGSVNGPKPDVYIRKTKSKIQRIIGTSSSIPGVTKVSGENTDLLTIEVWPSGVSSYQGIVRFTLVLEN